MNQAALDNALKRKFGRAGARGALRAMGFDSNEIDDVLEDNDMRTRRARDDDPIIDAESAMSAIEEIAGQLPDAEAAELANMIEERLLADVDEPGAADRRRKRRAEDARAGRSRRRLGKDEPPGFPGMPRVGGGQDPLTARAQDRAVSRRALTAAMDSAGAKSFDQLFPGAAHIRISG